MARLDGVLTPVVDAVEIRDLTTIDEFRAVRDLEVEIWGEDSADDAVGVPVFAASVKRGAILLGAFDGGRLVGFVYSFPGLRAGAVLQWSHMLGVLAASRGAGLARRLKLEQRDRALAMGVRLMEWTFDPLLATNAHLNLRVLGASAAEYLLDVYGASASPLHHGAPTDRLVAAWTLDAAHVERLANRSPDTGSDVTAAVAADVPAAIDRVTAGDWEEPVRIVRGLDAAVVRVPVPARFPAMLREAPGLAVAWRLATRDVFTGYFERGYRAVDFQRDPAGGGAYLLTRRV